MGGENRPLSIPSIPSIRDDFFSHSNFPSFPPQELLTETSRRFHSLADGRALLNDFRVELPSSWAGSDCEGARAAAETAAGALGAAADLVVTGRHPLFGSRPWSAQHGRCGVRGLRVELPYTGLLQQHNNDDDNNSTFFDSEDESDRLLREFVKFRFGVFEERGFRGDPLYPLEYIEGEEMRTNEGCNRSTNAQVSLKNEMHSHCTFPHVP